MKRHFHRQALKHVFFVLIFAAFATAAPSVAVELKGDPKKTPEVLQNVGVSERLGETIDLANLQFTDSADQKKHSLKEYFQNGKPTLVNLVYYECPMLCTMVLNGLSTGMKGLDWSIGDQYNVITVSINPKDDSEDAELKRDVYVKDYVNAKAQAGDESGMVAATVRNEANVRKGWHFFTGEEAQIQKLAAQLGFRYEYDRVQEQYAHSAVTFVLTPEGKISRYLYGIQYRPRDLRLALLEASRGKVGNVFDRLLMFCYHYEPGTRGYALKAVKVMQLGAALTVILLSGYLAYFWLQQSRRKRFLDKKGTL